MASMLSVLLAWMKNNSKIVSKDWLVDMRYLRSARCGKGIEQCSTVANGKANQLKEF